MNLNTPQPAAAPSCALAHYSQLAIAALSDPDLQRRIAYVSALVKHDWHFEHSDDGEAYRRGKLERAALMLEAAEIDEGFVIWNRQCPPEFRRGALSRACDTCDQTECGERRQCQKTDPYPRAAS